MAKKSIRTEPFDLAAARAQERADAAQAAAAEADALVGEANAELYDKYSLRDITNATALVNFRRRTASNKRPRPLPTVEAKPNTAIGAAARVAEIAQEQADRAQEEAKRLQALADGPRQVAAKTPSVPIKQGVKASVETVPMPVRLEVDQVQMLKLLASYERTTASHIIRECIRVRLEQARQGIPGFDDAVRSIMNR